MPPEKNKIILVPLFDKHHFILTAGRWKKMFSEEKYKLIIAMSLNDCLGSKHEGLKGMRIKGYLINGRSIYLVCETKAGQLFSFLDLFYSKVQRHIENELKGQSKRLSAVKAAGKYKNGVTAELSLFQRLPFEDGWLIQLITGSKVELPYHSPKLARLKKMVYNEPFCSVLDYEGGYSPVNIPSLKKAKLYPPNKSSKSN